MKQGSKKSLRVVAISDTHSYHWEIKVPHGDILIHAGDLTGYGRIDEVREFNEWLGTLPHPYKIVIAGNHDWCFQNDPLRAGACVTNGIYLQDASVVLFGLRFYGSPWQPWFHSWAFNLQRGAEIKHKWDLIPADTDVLITHGPPNGHCDLTADKMQAGCEELLLAVNRIQPQFHVFGHIHEAAGVSHNEHTKFINACTCDLGYCPINQPHVFELQPRSG